MTVIIFQKNSGELDILTSCKPCKAADTDIISASLCLFV